jgi:ATP synthase protein I
MKREHELKNQVERQVRRMQKAEQEKDTLFSQTVFIGTLGLILVLPVVAGAYLGNWLDNRATGYSVHWTVGLTLLGVIVGAVNMYLYIRE